MTTHRLRPPAQEQDHVSGTRAIAVAFAVLVISAISVKAVLALVEQPKGTRVLDSGALRLEQGPMETTAPGLELRERKRRELSRYGWVDREQGVVSIPIERAMELVVSQRGAP